MEKPRAAISVCIMQNGFLDIRYDGKDADLPCLLGGLITGQRRIQAKIDDMYQPQGDRGVQPIHECLKTVSKQEAFNEYAKLGEKIKKRLHAIHNADDQAKFEILDQVLIDKI